MRRALVILAAALLVAGALAALALRSPAVQDALVRRVAERALGARPDALFADGALRVLLCGTAVAAPPRDRARGPAPP